MKDAISRFEESAFGTGHDHTFLGDADEENERRTWMVIALCRAMMVTKIDGGSLFGSLALMTEGPYTSTPRTRVRC